MPNPNQLKGRRLVIAAVALAVPSVVSAAAAPKTEAKEVPKQVSKAEVDEPQSGALSVASQARPLPTGGRALQSLFEGLPELQVREASPFEPPGRPPGRPPDPPGLNDPPNPPGRPPGRPPDR